MSIRNLKREPRTVAELIDRQHGRHSSHDGQGVSFTACNGCSWVTSPEGRKGSGWEPQSPAKDGETWWMIEHRTDSTWWKGDEWTKNPNAAVRFTSKAEAQETIDEVLFWKHTDYAQLAFPTEHVWADARPEQPAPKGE